MILRLMASLAALAALVALPGALKAGVPGPLYGIGIVAEGDSPKMDPHAPAGTVLVRDHLTIREVMPGSPAEKSGLTQGDEIIQVDDRNVGGMSFNDACALIRGPDGTSVKITLIRPGEPNALSFTITRAHLDLPGGR